MSILRALKLALVLTVAAMLPSLFRIFFRDTKTSSVKVKRSRISNLDNIAYISKFRKMKKPDRWSAALVRIIMQYERCFWMQE